MTLGAYIGIKLIPFTISILSKLISNAFILKEIFLVFKRKVGFRDFFIGNLIISVTCLLPLFMVKYLFAYPQALSSATNSFLLFANPLNLFLYYLVFKSIFKIPDKITLIALEWTIVLQYLSIILFMIFRNVWTGILERDVRRLHMSDSDLLAMISVNLVAFLVWFILKKIISRFKFFLELPYDYPEGDIKREILNSFISVLTIYVILVSVGLLAISEYRISMKVDKVILFGLLFLMFSYRLLDQFWKQRIRIMEWQTKTTNAYVGSLIQAANDFRGIKHDFYNILQTYDGYLATDDIKGMKEYHKRLVQITKKVGSTLEITEAFSARKAVYSLFDIKADRAENLGVQFQTRQVELLCDVDMNDLDLCRILSNLLDNAIEAAMGSKERRMQLSCKKESDSYIMVEVENSTFEEVNVHQVLQSGFTTKEKHSGQGLYIVYQIINTYPECSIRIEHQNQSFSVVITFPCKEV